MRERKVNLILVLAEEFSESGFPFSCFAPFAVIMEHGVPRRRLTCEKVSDRKYPPLASTLELLQNRVDDLYKVKF